MTRQSRHRNWITCEPIQASTIQPLLMQYMTFESMPTQETLFKTINRIMTIAENEHMEGQLSASIINRLLRTWIAWGKGMTQYDVLYRMIFGVANLIDKNIIAEKLDVEPFNAMLEELVNGTNLTAKNQKILKSLIFLIRGEKGNTVLHWAFERGHTLCAKSLLIRNASYAIPNKAGKTAVDICIQKDDSGLSAMLCQQIMFRYTPTTGAYAKTDILNKVIEVGDHEAEKFLRNFWKLEVAPNLQPARLK